MMTLDDYAIELFLGEYIPDEMLYKAEHRLKQMLVIAKTDITGIYGKGFIREEIITNKGFRVEDIDTIKERLTWNSK